jgi:hypothetical protein
LATPLVLTLAVLFGALAFVTYILWPRWPGAVVGLDAPAFPITVSTVAFNVPPAALRVSVQRRPGAHERVDLVFLWPSLAPPDPAAKPILLASGQPLERPPIDRIFVTIAASDGTLAPADRVKTIYRRYTLSEPSPGPNGLAILAFRNDTPYQGEDLIYDAASPERFVVRCTRNGVGPALGMCLYDRRIESADLTVRFPRDWLEDWRNLAAGIDRLISQLRPKSG